MWEERALRVRGALADLAATGVGVGEVHATAIRLVDGWVPSELTCWATLDPESLAISSMTSGVGRIPVEFEPLLAAAEYDPTEPHRFAALAERGQALARMSDLTAAERAGSRRATSVWRPLGMSHELRFLFLLDGICWGAAGMVRSGRDFTERELEFLLSVAPAIAAATRLALRAAPSGLGAHAGPAIVVVDADGSPRSMTAEAGLWQERLDTTPGLFRTMMAVMAAGLRGSGAGSFRTHVRTRDGQWALLHASELVGAQENATAVCIERADGLELLGLVLAAHGLTPRERAVCAEVLLGRSTAEIADSLFISTNTVQDHLKAIFAKFSVHSRGKLTARLRPML